MEIIMIKGKSWENKVNKNNYSKNKEHDVT